MAVLAALISVVDAREFAVDLAECLRLRQIKLVRLRVDSVSEKVCRNNFRAGRFSFAIWPPEEDVLFRKRQVKDDLACLIFVGVAGVSGEGIRCAVPLSWTSELISKSQLTHHDSTFTSEAFAPRRGRTPM
jgi:hypothetical protein